MCTRRSLPATEVDDHSRSDLSQSRQTTHDSCTGRGDARNRSHARQESVACDAVFVGIAYIPASKDDERVARSLSNLAASTTANCVAIQSEAFDERVNASHGVDTVRRSPDATDIVGCCVAVQERGRHDVSRLFLDPNVYAR